MKFSELTEDAPPKDIRNMITSIALSLVATGRDDINVQSLISEIKKRTNIDVPYNVMIEILDTLPFVGATNNDTVSLNGGEESDNDGESSEETVTDMATKAASNNLKQDI